MTAMKKEFPTGSAKRELRFECACCDGDVVKGDYGFNVLQPPSLSIYLLCEDCKRVLSAGKRADRRRLEKAFLKRLASGELPT